MAAAPDPPLPGIPAAPTAVLAERVAGVLAVPLHRWLGIRLRAAGDPASGFVLDVGPNAVNNTGVLHGGLVPGLLDVACYLALLPRLDPGTNAVTHDTATSLLRSVPGGAQVTFTGEILRLGRTLAFCRGQALCDGRQVAVATITKSVVPVAVPPPTGATP